MPTWAVVAVVIASLVTLFSLAGAVRGPHVVRFLTNTLRVLVTVAAALAALILWGVAWLLAGVAAVPEFRAGNPGAWTWWVFFIIGWVFLIISIVLGVVAV